MDTVNINRLELLEIVKANLETHKTDILSAKTARLAQYKADVAKALDDPEGLREITVPKVPDNTTEYESTVRKLELSVDDVIALESHEFDNYVMDKWHSTRLLKGMLNTYSASGML